MNVRFFLTKGLQLAGAGLALLSLFAGCTRINVMGRDVSDAEYFASHDLSIARERRRLEPEAHDEHGRIPSWDQFWCMAAGAVPPTAQSRRMKRYIIEKRRAFGLPELTCGLDYQPEVSFRPDHYYPPGDPRIFRW